MNGPLVSCIVPVFNGERFLREAIESILAQTYPCLEVIVVDDGSTDGTSSVVASLGERVTYVRQDNAGPATARNRGIREARGEFVAFLDADDLWLDTKIAKQIARFQARPELAYGVTLTQNFWEAEAQEEEERLAGHRRSAPIPGYVTQTLLVRREWLEATGGFNTSLAHGDAADWFQRADAAGAKGELLDEVLTRRRMHSANRSRIHAARSRDEFLRMLKVKLDLGRTSTP